MSGFWEKNCGKNSENPNEFWKIRLKLTKIDVEVVMVSAAKLVLRPDDLGDLGVVARMILVQKDWNICALKTCAKSVSSSGPAIFQGMSTEPGYSFEK